MYIRSFTQTAAVAKTTQSPDQKKAPETNSPALDSFCSAGAPAEPLLSPGMLSIQRSATTQEMVDRIQEQLDREWKFFGSQTYDADGRLLPGTSAATSSITFCVAGSSDFQVSRLMDQVTGVYTPMRPALDA